MSKTLLCLSGWAQKHDSLEIVFTNSSIKNDYKIYSLDYSNFDSVDDFFQKLKETSHCEIAMGWSLGGQLLIRAIANNIINPKLLILLAPPFQMLKDSRINSGMSQELYKKINDLLDNDSSIMLKEFLILNAMNDRNSKEIIKSLAINQKNFKQIKFWYEELCRFSCFDLDMSKMPAILYFHGSGDMVVNISQKDYFQKYCHNFKSNIFNKCGHAPHISRTQEVYQAIEDEIKHLQL